MRLLMIKAGGTVMIWADAAGAGGQKVKPLKWTTPPTVVEQGGRSSRPTDLTIALAGRFML